VPMTTRDPTGDEQAAITNLLARYCLSLDHDDIETWVSLFTKDASFNVYGRSFDGHEGLRKMMVAAPKGLHLGGPPLILMHDDNGAQTEQNLLFIDRQSGVSRSAVYRDEVVRSEDGWKISSRTCWFIVPDGLSDRPME
jgi:3-phenylpropionate/cinnamic acid dioxygenase small subunit